MRLTFLGTGTSTGVPVIGCHCPTCMSSDPRDKRLRSSVLLEGDGQRVLIDPGPDFRQQALRAGITSLAAILITHQHYDHVGGLDDVRPLGSIDIYADERSQEAIHRCLPYCFGDKYYPGAPVLTLHLIKGTEPWNIGPWTVVPLPVMHGKLPIYGFRIGDIAYMTDVKTIPESTYELLDGLDLLVLNGLRTEPHPTHLSISEAVDVAARIGARRTLLTHLAHSAPKHEELCAKLPGSVQPAYDGMIIDIYQKK